MNNKKELLRRYAILFFGMFIMSFGVAFAIKGGLGTSPISSVSYVLSVIAGITVGIGTIIFNTALVFLQILLLRKDFEKVQLLQLPVTFVFGIMNDIAIGCIDWIHPGNYLQQWLCCIAGILLMGIGVSIEVAPNVLTLPGEGIVNALSKVTGKKFGVMKVAVDTSCAVTAIIIGFAMGFGLLGVREGTIVTALCTGNVVRKVKPIVEKVFKVSKND